MAQTDICRGWLKDCGEEPTTIVESGAGKWTAKLCDDCALEYQQYLALMGWDTQPVTT